MSRKFLGLIAVLFICIGVLAFNTYYKKEGLEKNGVQTSAVITKITTNKLDSDIGLDIDNFHVTYEYKVNGKSYQKIQEIVRQEHDLYFEKPGKVGDSLKIVYDSEKPTNSRIEKIKE